jgi:hypothetical protein
MHLLYLLVNLFHRHSFSIFISTVGTQLIGYDFSLFVLKCINVQVIYDRETGQSRGFGYVTMNTVQEAETAVRMYNGSVSVFCKLMGLV